MIDYDAVLFDSDGVLVEPPARDTQAEATREAFRAVGVDAPDPDHVEAVVDGVTVDGLADLCREYDIDPERFWEARERRDERSQLTAFREANRVRYDDVSVLADLPTPRGVVSNNHHSTIAFVLEFFDLEPLFDTFYGRPKTIDSLERKKPNTYYLERTLTDLGVESGLYVGDSESDVHAAKRAGLDSALVRRRHNRDLDLDVTPDYEIESLTALGRPLDDAAGTS